MGIGIPYGLPDGFALVAAEIVQHHHITGLQRWNQRLLNPGVEAFPVDWPIEQEGRVHPVTAQGGEKGIGPPAPVRRLADQPLAAFAPAPERSHVGLGPGLVNEDQTGRINALLMASPAEPSARDLRPVLLRGERAFF